MDHDALLDYHYAPPRFRGVSGQHARPDSLAHLELDFSSPNSNNDPFAQWQPQSQPQPQLPGFDPFGQGQGFGSASVEQLEAGFSQPYGFGLEGGSLVEGLGFEGMEQGVGQRHVGMRSNYGGDVIGDDLGLSRRTRRLSVRAEVSRNHLSAGTHAHQARPTPSVLLFNRVQLA